jgi:HPt (histidine-containing phosphotransfer) domain-containing protein
MTPLLKRETQPREPMTRVVVEKTALLETLDHDPQLLREVIGIFLADCPGKLAELRAAITAGDPERIANSSHSLRGSVATFGVQKAVEVAQKLESMGRQRQLQGAAEAFSVLEREMALVTSALAEIAKEAF